MNKKSEMLQRKSLERKEDLVKRKSLSKSIIIISLVAVLAIVAPVLSGCFGKPAAAPAEPAPAAPAEVEPIVIGVPTMLSGPAAADGTEIVNGMIMAVEEMNARGGLLGRPVEYVTADVVDWTAEYQIAARDYLMGFGVDAFFPGYGLDPSYLDVFQGAETGGMPYIHVGTTELFADLFAENPDLYWNTIQFVDTAMEYGPYAYIVFVKEIAKLYDYPNKTVAFLTSELTYNQEISDGFKKWVVEDPDWEVVVDETHPFGALEFGVQLAKIREANPGIIFFSDVTVPSSVAFVRQFLEDPTDSLVHVQYAPSIPEFRAMLDEQSVGIMWQSQVVVNPTKEALVWRNAYIARFGVEPGACLAWSSYDMVMMWVEAVEAVGDVKDYRAIVDYLVNTHIKGFTYTPGGLNIDPNTNTNRIEAHPPYIVEKYPGDRKLGYGNTIHYYQIQMTAEGPKDILVYNQFKPNMEYFEENFGYPPQFEVDDEGKAEFKIPPWIGQ